ncbi:MAG: hypothetical protein IT427_16220 [Pirellulales bacterium]|nr:hypothetical protein [Pirellulales bacterium]
MMTNETKQDNRATLKCFLQGLTAGETVPMPVNEPWEAAMERIQRATGPAEIDERIYFWFLEVLPPRFMDGNYFCFAEGMEPFRLFWKSNGQYFARQLDWRETKALCRLANTPVY